MTVSYELISCRIRELRLERGLSQAQLAEKAGTTTPYINHIENGRKKPSLEMLIFISSALNVSVDALLRGNPEDQSATIIAEVRQLISDCDSHDQRILLQMLGAMKKILKENQVL